LATKNRGQAKAAKIRVLDTIKDIKRGRLQIPDNAEPGLFILTDGKVVEQPKAPTVRTLGDLFRNYQENLPPGVKEESTLACEQIHMRHLLRHVGSHRQLSGLTSKDLQAYITRRLGGLLAWKAARWRHDQQRNHNVSVDLEVGREAGVSAWGGPCGWA